MKSLKDWRSSKINEDTAWNQIKDLNIASDPSIKEFVLPKIERIQEELIEKIKVNNPKIQTFRDVPPNMRDIFAQAIVSSVLDLFYEGMRSSSENYGKNNVSKPENLKITPSPILPQDQLQTPVASKG